MKLLRSITTALFLAAALGAVARDIELLNVSYDPTREFHVEFNRAFAAHWLAQTGDNVTVKQSHGGSGKQARAVIDGLAADVVTLALAGDVFLSWENEAFLALKEFGSDQFEIVVPALSILAEPPAAIVDKVVDRKGTRAVAQAYLEHLYSDEGQDLAGKHFYRPTNPAAAAKYASQFVKVELFTIEQAFGSWANAQKVHFADGGSFDRIYAR